MEIGASIYQKQQNCSKLFPALSYSDSHCNVRIQRQRAPSFNRAFILRSAISFAFSGLVHIGLVGPLRFRPREERPEDPCAKPAI